MLLLVGWLIASEAVRSRSLCDFHRAARESGAEREAQETRAPPSQGTRSGTEHHVGLSVRMTSSASWRALAAQKVIAEFSQRQIATSMRWPPGLKGTGEGPQLAPLAMVHHAKVMRSSGNLDLATGNARVRRSTVGNSSGRTATAPRRRSCTGARWYSS